MADRFVILDRIELGWTPPYCVHGRATCVGGCGEWVYLGDQTVKVVTDGTADPLCKQCVAKFVSPDAERFGHINDRRRVDGPH